MPVLKYLSELAEPKAVACILVMALLMYLGISGSWFFFIGMSWIYVGAMILAIIAVIVAILTAPITIPIYLWRRRRHASFIRA